MRTAFGIIALLIVILILGMMCFRRLEQLDSSEVPESEPAAEAIVVTPPIVSKPKKEAPSPEFISLEEEIAVLVDKVKAADAEHRRLVQEEKKTFPLFDQEENLTPGEVAARRQKHAQEQLARKKAVATASAKLRELNLELKRKRRELRSL